MEMTHNLRIDNPCPFVPKRMNKNGNNYFCKSCRKTIVDFRGKTIDEVKDVLNKNTCGIFSIDQLPSQQEMTFFYKMFFYFLTILSFLGFTVNPLSAQTITTPTKKDTVIVDAKNNSKSDKTTIKKFGDKTESKGLFRRKKKRRVIVGCPSF